MYGETRPVTQDIVEWDRFLIQVIKAFAKAHDIELELISSGWIMRLRKDDITRFIFGLDLGLNNSASKLIARDKAATSDILELDGVPHIQHKLILRPESLGSNPKGNWSNIMQYFAECKEDMVCKPNFGSSGSGVERVQTQAQLERTMQKLLVENRAVAISPFVDMQAEYRVTVLDGNVELLYKKIKTDKDYLQFNLCKGAYAQQETNEELAKEVRELAVRAAKALGLRLANVDVSLSASGEMQILEVNSGIMFEHYSQQGEEEQARAKAVYIKALKKLFN